MNQFLFYLFAWTLLGFVFTTTAGIKTGFWWFIFLGLPAAIIVGMLLLGFVVATIGALIGWLHSGR